MYVYIRSEPGLWTVGFYEPNGRWHSESDHSDREEAAKRVRWLNGGDLNHSGTKKEGKAPGKKARHQGVSDVRRACGGSP